MNTRRVGAALLFALGLSLATEPASAFCRSRTCDPRKEECDTDERNCIIEGQLLFWRTPLIPMWIDARGSTRRGITADETEQLVAQSFEPWLQAECSEGLTPNFGLTIEGQLPEGDAGFDDTQGATNYNVVTYVDSGWPHAAAAVALTTMTFNTRNGEVIDADVELNAATFPLAVDPMPGEVDVGAVMTHEAGHVLALAHSDVPGATMQPETRGFGFHELSSLEEDDVAGICEIYSPVEDEPNGADPPPFSSGDGCSCRVASHAGVRGAAGAWFALLMLSALRRFRTRDV